MSYDHALPLLATGHVDPEHNAGGRTYDDDDETTCTIAVTHPSRTCVRRVHGTQQGKGAPCPCPVDVKA